jgi:hypothetical protein
MYNIVDVMQRNTGVWGAPPALAAESWSSAEGWTSRLSDYSTPVTKVSSRVHALSTPSSRALASRLSLFKGDRELSGVLCALLEIVDMVGRGRRVIAEGDQASSTAAVVLRVDEKLGIRV